MIRTALLYTWNVLVVVGMLAAARYGFIEATQANDTTGITWGIVAVFAASQLVAWWPAGRYNCRSNPAFNPNVKRADLVYDAATVMVLLGVIGTIVGFMDALQEVSAGDTSGVSVALWTTLVGLIGSILNFITHRLMGGTKG